MYRDSYSHLLHATMLPTQQTIDKFPHISLHTYMYVIVGPPNLGCMFRGGITWFWVDLKLLNDFSFACQKVSVKMGSHIKVFSCQCE